MKSRSSQTIRRVAALLLAGAMLPACADPGGMPESGMSFKDYDRNKDGYLSLDEFKAKGKDDLAFKAADVDSDARLDRSEFDQFLTRKATDEGEPASGTSGEPKSAQPPTGY